MKFLKLVVFVFIGFIGTAQDINVDGTDYVVKGHIILMDGKDVTETLPAEKKEGIMAAFDVKKVELMKVNEAKVKAEQVAKAEQKARKEADKLNKAEAKLAKAEEKAAKAEEKAQKEAEKAAKAEEKAKKKAKKENEKAEKEQKKAEKELKKEEKAQSNFVKAGAKHTDAILKYEKLKSKGELSPVDEEKWIKKIDKLNVKLKKSKGKI